MAHIETRVWNLYGATFSTVHFTLFRFWELLHNLCPLREISCTELSASDVLMTSFCQGRGDRLYYLGQVSTSMISSGLTLITPTVMRIKLGWKVSGRKCSHAPPPPSSRNMGLVYYGMEMGLPPPPRKGMGPMEVSWDGDGVPPRKGMGPMGVLWDGDGVPPRKGMGPVEVLWDGDGVPSALLTDRYLWKHNLLTSFGSGL